MTTSSIELILNIDGNKIQLSLIQKYNFPPLSLDIDFKSKRKEKVEFFSCLS